MLIVSLIVAGVSYTTVQTVLPVRCDISSGTNILGDKADRAIDVEVGCGSSFGSCLGRDWETIIQTDICSVFV